MKALSLLILISFTSITYGQSSKHICYASKQFARTPVFQNPVAAQTISQAKNDAIRACQESINSKCSLSYCRKTNRTKLSDRFGRFFRWP